MSRKVCGSRHPNYPDLVCLRYGTCSIDWHTGVAKDEFGEEETVEWGVLAEKLSSGTVRVVPIVHQELLNA